MQKKYKLTTNTITHQGKTLYQIKALIDIPKHDVKVGDFGGFIEKEDNLSHEGDCWVSHRAMVSENAKILHDALIHGHAKVLGNAEVYGAAIVSGEAFIHGNARIFGSAVVTGNARIYGNANVCGSAHITGCANVSDEAVVSGFACVYQNARVYGDANICGNALISGEAQICGKAYVCGQAKVNGDTVIKTHNDWMAISNLGNNSRTITVTLTDKMIVAGCFRGGLAEFKKAVDRKYHGEGNYYPAIKMIEALFNEEKNVHNCVLAWWKRVFKK